MKSIYRICLASAISLTTLATTTVAHADTWACGFVGNWTESIRPRDNRPFSWDVRWNGSGYSWTIAGKVSDDLGDSSVSGRCDGSNCDLTQVYYSGVDNGKVFYWKGAYTTEKVSDSMTIDRFNGTWSHTPEARAFDGGFWNATATCRYQY